MDKSDLILRLRGRCSWLREVDARAIVDAVFGEHGIIADSLAGGHEVTVTGFGTFGLAKVAASVINGVPDLDAVGPAAPQRWTVEAHKRPTFRAGAALKRRVRAG